MAELAAAASVVGLISLAVQIGDSLIKLKAFRDHVKDAPSELVCLIEELEIFKLILDDLHSRTSNFTGGVMNEHSPKCLELCYKTVGMLEEFAQELVIETKRRSKLGSFRLALKKGSIDRLRERLKSVRSILMISRQSYMETLQFVLQAQLIRHIEITRRHETEKPLETISVSVDTSKMLPLHDQVSGEMILHNESTVPCIATTTTQLEPCTDIDHFSTKRITRRRNHTSRRLQKSSPWVCALGYFFERYQYKIQLQVITTYTGIRWDSAIVRLIVEGDVAGMQKLFSEGKLSPLTYVDDKYGFPPRTLLDRAVQRGNFEMCRLLISQGAETDFNGPGSTLRISLKSDKMPGYMIEHYSELLRLVLDNSNIHETTDDEAWGAQSLATYFRGDVDSFQLLAGRLGYAPKHWSLHECVLFAMKVTTWGTQPYLIPIAKFILEGRSINDICSIVDIEYGTLLHSTIKHFAELYEVYRKDYDRHAEEWHVPMSENPYSDTHGFQHAIELNKTIDFMRDLVLGGIMLHSCRKSRNNGRLVTPLLLLLSTYFKSYSCQLSNGSMTIESREMKKRFDRMTYRWQKTVRTPVPVLIWLQSLRKWGVDLEQYGREEKNVYLNSSVRLEFQGPPYVPIWIDFIEHKWFDASTRLINFTFGPEPEDWHFFFEPVFEVWFMDFWDMIDNPVRVVPGAWPEEEYRFPDSRYGNWDCEI